MLTWVLSDAVCGMMADVDIECTSDEEADCTICSANDSSSPVWVDEGPAVICCIEADADDAATLEVYWS